MSGHHVHGSHHVDFDAAGPRLARNADLDTLLDDDDPQGILRRPDVFLLAARTVHVARWRERA